MRASVVTDSGLRFDPQFGTGVRTSISSGVPQWPENGSSGAEAPAFELVPPADFGGATIKRALVRGGISVKYAVAQPLLGVFA